jgi:hypothetical protein
MFDSVSTLPLNRTMPFRFTFDVFQLKPTAVSLCFGFANAVVNRSAGMSSVGQYCTLISPGARIQKEVVRLT